jgi:hypothetical protein
MDKRLARARRRALADTRREDTDAMTEAAEDRRSERVTQAMAAVAHALRDDTALTLAGQRELGEQLAASSERLAGAVEGFAAAVRQLGKVRWLRPPDPEAAIPTRRDWLARPVDDLPGLPSQLAQRLHGTEIHTVGELVARGRDLPRLKHVGAKGILAICRALLAVLGAPEGEP